MEKIVLITVTLNLRWEYSPTVKKTIQKFKFESDDDCERREEIQKFVYDSLKIYEIEECIRHVNRPDRKYKTLVIENSLGQKEISAISIDHVIEGEWEDC